MSSIQKISVDLDELAGVYFIVAHESGVEYDHQCGGLSCYQRSLEGFLVPAGQSTQVCEELYAYFCTGPKYGGHCHSVLDKEDALFIDQCLASFDYSMLTVDRDLLRESVEAWVHLKVVDGMPCFPCCYNSDPASKVVMIWNNSD
ncbi:MAG: hypothetical protein KDA66_05010 [Planctomycetaceae bacterium]|nr:hypothetical protein [Planctomycetaceae bacterium]